MGNSSSRFLDAKSSLKEFDFAVCSQTEWRSSLNDSKLKALLLDDSEGLDLSTIDEVKEYHTRIGYVRQTAAAAEDEKGKSVVPSLASKFVFIEASLESLTALATETAKHQHLLKHTRARLKNSKDEPEKYKLRIQISELEALCMTTSARLENGHETFKFLQDDFELHRRLTLAQKVILEHGEGQQREQKREAAEIERDLEVPAGQEAGEAAEAAEAAAEAAAGAAGAEEGAADAEEGAAGAEEEEAGAGAEAAGAAGSPEPRAPSYEPAPPPPLAAAAKDDLYLRFKKATQDRDAILGEMRHLYCEALSVAFGLVTAHRRPHSRSISVQDMQDIPSPIFMLLDVNRDHLLTPKEVHKALQRLFDKIDAAHKEQEHLQKQLENNATARDAALHKLPARAGSQEAQHRPASEGGRERVDEEQAELEEIDPRLVKFDVTRLELNRKLEKVSNKLAAKSRMLDEVCNVWKPYLTDEVFTEAFRELSSEEDLATLDSFFASTKHVRQCATDAYEEQSAASDEAMSI